MREFYEVRDVPVHSVLLMPTREVAVGFPKGDILLGFCDGCGFVSNTDFDASAHSYSSEYEETQIFSATFREFHERVARSLVERFGLHGKHIIEIGCGKGDFLATLCEMGDNRGTGFDPAFVEERNPTARSGVQFIRDFYSEKYTSYQGDLVCCKMTLEHIPDTAQFMATVRRSIGDRFDTIVFFQVPNATPFEPEPQTTTFRPAAWKCPTLSRHDAISARQWRENDCTSRAVSEMSAPEGIFAVAVLAGRAKIVRY